MVKIAIMGYGNLGKGVEAAAAKSGDVSLYGVFTKRAPESVKTATDAPVYSASDVLSHKGRFDVLVICGGSATDLPYETPLYAKDFNVVDSFDTHANIPEHFAAVDSSAKSGGNAAVISVGWDPGLFSLARIYSESVLPDGNHYTFWGRGVSQGHSDAIRRIDGVADARQYTVPVTAALEKVRNGGNPTLTTREKHTRECFVVAKEGADKKKIEEEIKTMPNYFADYNTTVHFITKEEMEKDHAAMPHGGFVIRTGKTGLSGENNHVIEYSLKLDSNPEFTGSVLVAFARAAARLNKEGKTGALTAFDIAPAYLSPKSGEELRKELL